MRLFSKGLLAAIALIAAHALPAAAAPIVGDLNMFGDFKPTTGGAATNNLSIANGIDFLPAGGGTGTFMTGTGTDDLATFGFQTGGTIKDFTFNPFAAINGFYSITVGGMTLTFDLTSLTIATQNTNFLNMSGSGTLHLTGFDDTPGTWNFSGQSSNGTSPRAIFSWSAGSESTPVPEPASLALLGFGLLVVGARHRRRRKAV